MLEVNAKQIYVNYVKFPFSATVHVNTTQISLQQFV